MDKDGTPALTFLRWFNMDFAGAIERQEAAQAVTDAALAAAQADIIATQAAQADIIADLDAEVDRLSAVLAGTEPFTAVNVGGNTIAESGGLSDDVVTTSTVVQGDITPIYSALTTGAVLWSAESGEKDLQSVAVTVVRGTVKISAQCNIQFDGVASTATVGILRLYRDGVELTLARISLNALISSGANFIFPQQWMLSYEEAPGAGTYTYKITFEPGAVNNGQISQRSLSALPMEG